MQVALSQRMEIGEDDNIERKMKVCLPCRVAAILKESPIVLQGNSAIVTINPKKMDGDRGCDLKNRRALPEVSKSMQVLTWTLHLSWERESPYDCSELNGKLAETRESIDRCWEGSFESESSSEVQLCVASSVVNAGLVGDDSKAKQGC
jgi:hypothetical protein